MSTFFFEWFDWMMIQWMNWIEFIEWIQRYKMKLSACEIIPFTLNHDHSMRNFLYNRKENLLQQRISPKFPNSSIKNKGKHFTIIFNYPPPFNIAERIRHHRSKLPKWGHLTNANRPFPPAIRARCWRPRSSPGFPVLRAPFPWPPGVSPCSRPNLSPPPNENLCHLIKSSVQKI